jgi:hypothetical protein
VDYKTKLINGSLLFSALIFGAVMMLFPGTEKATAQTGLAPYEVKFAPDLWYNDVDGIRAGLRMRGQVPGTFDDGPHRLDTGIWLGLWFPKMPVSYYVKYTNIIESISDFNSEGSYSLITSYRTGFHRHGVRFDKRWQPGFNEDVFSEAFVFAGAHRHVDNEYLAFPVMFQDSWVGFLQSGVRKQSVTDFGTTFLQLNLNSGLFDTDKLFLQAIGEVRYSKPLISDRVTFRARVSGGAQSDNVPAEYFITASMSSPIEWMNSGFYRAKGTIPMPWMNSGNIQITGLGPNIRGYSNRDVNQLKDGIMYGYEFYGALNLELDYPNPIDYMFNRIPILGDFLRLRSYLFYDAIRGSNLVAKPSDPFINTPGFNSIVNVAQEGNLSDAGTGFALTLNIPDQLGKPRGFVLRYDIPFWLSHPQGEDDNFKFRSVFSFGAVIGF